MMEKSRKLINMNTPHSKNVSHRQEPRWANCLPSETAAIQYKHYSLFFTSTAEPKEPVYSFNKSVPSLCGCSITIYEYHREGEGASIYLSSPLCIWLWNLWPVYTLKGSKLSKKREFVMISSVILTLYFPQEGQLKSPPPLPLPPPSFGLNIENCRVRTTPGIPGKLLEINIHFSSRPGKLLELYRQSRWM